MASFHVEETGLVSEDDHIEVRNPICGLLFFLVAK
jgi:hypothetical protein